jgi:transcriptional regulator of met regulon
MAEAIFIGIDKSGEFYRSPRAMHEQILLKAIRVSIRVAGFQVLVRERNREILVWLRRERYKPPASH